MSFSKKGGLQMKDINKQTLSALCQVYCEESDSYGYSKYGRFCQEIKMNYSPYVNYFTRVYWNRSYFVYKINTVISFQSWEIMETFFLKTDFKILKMGWGHFTKCSFFFCIAYTTYRHTHQVRTCKCPQVDPTGIPETEYCVARQRNVLQDLGKHWSMLQDNNRLPHFWIPLTDILVVITLFLCLLLLCFQCYSN